MLRITVTATGTDTATVRDGTTVRDGATGTDMDTGPVSASARRLLLHDV